MNIFYSQTIKDNAIILDEFESHHCVKVLRTKKGDLVHVVDGRGGFYEAILEQDHPSKSILSISRKEQLTPLPYRLHIGIAPTKSIDRFEWFLEKATEIGVSEITPLMCERSERSRLRPDRLRKVLVAAMKQSKRAWLPVLNEPVSFMDWTGIPNDGIQLIAHCGDGPELNLWKMSLPDEVHIAIGPEGDFSDSEIDHAVKSGFVEVTLGTYRLRTETAGIMACSAIYFQKFN